MKRTIIKIDEELCNGCGLCIEGCHEGALQLIDGKARMISDLYCDGLGACIPECPVEAISLEEREAEPYDEYKVMERISPKGEATVLAHLNHLIDHEQFEFVQQGIDYIKENNLEVDISKLKKFTTEKNMNHKEETTELNDRPEAEVIKQSLAAAFGHGGGCPGSRMMNFDKPKTSEKQASGDDQPSALRQWPVQLHLLNPEAPYFRNADVLLAADCVAFAMGNFHSKHLKGKGLAIACPKLDHGKELYVEKLTAMINRSNINTLTVMKMTVPCCSGLLAIAKTAADQAERKVPVKSVTVSLEGEVIKEEWV
ncbi:MAG: 4Fe-4S binding protein [Bacteroidales bacterium]|nr:4Fe-4S binding protein [Bacteroidales bacterium]